MIGSASANHIEAFTLETLHTSEECECNGVLLCKIYVTMLNSEYTEHVIATMIHAGCI